MAVVENDLFYWVVNDNPQHSFLGYPGISDDDTFLNKLTNACVIVN
jgi:hypothetical protein